MLILKSKYTSLVISTILLCILLVFAMFVWVASGQQDQKAQLIQALQELEEAIVFRMDTDVETIAAAFTDAEDIRRNRKWAVVFDVPLTIIGETIGVLKSVVSAVFNPCQVIQVLVVITTKPGRVKVLKPIKLEDKTLQPGDIVYTYTYLGEGVVKAWFQGKMYHRGISDSPPNTFHLKDSMKSGKNRKRINGEGA
jgi:hypothetical protein